MTYRKRWLSPMLMIVGVMCACMVAIMGTGASAYAASNDSIPGGNVADPVVRSVDIAKPAVVRIITVVSGHLSVTFSNGSSVNFPQDIGKEYQQELSGTGTLITAKGDILTADHVVNPPGEVFYTLAAQDIVTYMNQHPVAGQGTVTADQVVQNLQSGQLKSTPVYSNKQSVAFLSTDYSGPLAVTDVRNVPAQLRGDIQIEKESAVDQKDVAIVHANFPITDLPLVQLGDSSTVQQQDDLTIIGFPGNGDVSTTATNLLTSSVNKINVSSIKTTDTGAPVIQVGGNVEHGDSGGPALDSKGTVVGVVSFGLQSASDPGGTAFLQASSSAQGLLQTLNLDTKPGPFQTQWAQAFNEYASSDAGHWHKAMQEFQQLATNYPQFQAVTPYLNYAKTQASTEKVATTPTAQAKQPTGGASQPGSWQALALTVGALLGLIALVALLFGVVSWQRKRQVKGGGVAGSSSSSASARGAAPAANMQARSPQAGAVAPPVQVPRTPTPPVAGKGAHDDDVGDMTAFGAPPTRGSSQTPVPATPSLPTTPQGTISLRVWPCGHMNRPNARFCTICGEPAPEPPTITIKRVEQ